MPSAQRPCVHAFYRSVQSDRGGGLAPSSSMKSWACWRSPAVRDSNSRSSTSSYTSASSWTCAARAGSQRSAERLERRSDARIEQRQWRCRDVPRAARCGALRPRAARAARPPPPPAAPSGARGGGRGGSPSPLHGARQRATAPEKLKNQVIADSLNQIAFFEHS